MSPDYSFRSFGECMFFGVEYDLLIFIIGFYSIVDLIFGNTFASILATFVMDRLLVFIRQKFGKKNVKEKTLIDDRFLM